MSTTEVYTTVTGGVDENGPLTLVSNAAAGAQVELSDVVWAASAAARLDLGGAYDVELAVQLLHRLGEIAERLRDLTVELGGRVRGGAGRGTESGPACVESVVDVHDSSPSVGVSAAGTAGTSDPTVGDAPGVPSLSGTPGATLVKRRLRGAAAEARLDDVATLWREARDRGSRTPTRDVCEALNAGKVGNARLSRGRVRHLVSEARVRGLLPPAVDGPRVASSASPTRTTPDATLGGAA